MVNDLKGSLNRLPRLCLCTLISNPKFGPRSYMKLDVCDFLDIDDINAYRELNIKLRKSK